jgi:histidine triad (HIT) family protein
VTKPRTPPDGSGIDRPDWYCDEVIPGRSSVEMLIETDEALAFRPDRPGFGTEHIIVVPKQHVRSLLELDPRAAPHLVALIQQVAADVVSRHGGCQLITTLGDEQHNRHLHFHVAAGQGVARSIPPA